ncbi:MAG: hypothetical protein KJO12_07720, partial [Ignavibacteria bacterium]|nr:hypothetical protein [Ignavibacteria bacterium]
MNRLIFTLFLLIMVVSCREDILHPDDFAGSINEPVQLISRNSYTFIINAKDLSMTISALASFSTTL